MHFRIGFALRAAILCLCLIRTSAPTEIVVGSIIPISGDDVSTFVDLPFPFDFYCSTYSKVGISTNALITFGSTLSNSYTNIQLPAAITNKNPGNMLSAFWDDLACFSQSLWMYSDDTSVIFQWTNYGFYKTPLPLGTFQTHLFLNQSIVFYYYSLSGSDRALGNSATVGLENAGGTLGLTISFNTPTLRTGLCYHISPTPACDYTWTTCSMDPVFVTVPEAPEPPTGLAYADATFSWNPSERAGSYQLFVARDTAFSVAVQNSPNLTGPSYVNESVIDSGVYYWKVGYEGIPI
jgi:hypothetical protein